MWAKYFFVQNYVTAQILLYTSLSFLSITPFFLVVALFSGSYVHITKTLHDNYTSSIECPKACMHICHFLHLIIHLYLWLWNIGGGGNNFLAFVFQYLPLKIFCLKVLLTFISTCILCWFFLFLANNVKVSWICASWFSILWLYI